MRNVFAAFSRTTRRNDLTTAPDVSLAAEQVRSRTRSRAQHLGGIVSSLSTAFRPNSSGTPGGTRPRRVATAVAASTLAGFARNPLAVEVTGALLKERLSRNKRERSSDAQESVSTEGTRISIEDRPSLPTPPGADLHPELSDQASSREELDEAKSNQDIPNNPHSESAPVSEFKDSSGWVMITQAPSPVDPPPALSNSTQSLGAASSPSPLGSPNVYHRDFAYPSSSSLGSSAVQAQALAQTPLHPSISNTSFVTALTSLTFDASPRSSVVGRVPFVIGNRCESPTSMPNFKRPPPARRLSSLRVTTATDAGGESGNGVGQVVEEHGRQAFGLPSAVTEESSEATEIDGQDTKRRALIIGNSYRTGTRKTYTMYSIKTLPGAENDIPLLKEVLEGRGYNVDVLDHDGFRREDVLERVAAFLRDAKPGHIRAVAFIGHACGEPDGKIVLVPPHCPTPDMAIPQADWEHTLRTNAAAGSIVFLIMAHCFSGAFMKQDQDCQTWKAQGPVPHPHPVVDRPVFVTFASSTGSQSSFESTVEPEDPGRAQDHFLYALAMTMKTDKIHTWEEFFAAFRHHFDRARSGASWAERFDPEKHSPEEAVPASESEHISAWRPANRQDPIFSASEILGYSDMFKLPVFVS